MGQREHVGADVGAAVVVRQPVQQAGQPLGGAFAQLVLRDQPERGLQLRLLVRDGQTLVPALQQPLAPLEGVYLRQQLAAVVVEPDPLPLDLRVQLVSEGGQRLHHALLDRRRLVIEKLDHERELRTVHPLMVDRRCR